VQRALEKRIETYASVAVLALAGAPCGWLGIRELISGSYGGGFIGVCAASALFAAAVRIVARAHAKPPKEMPPAPPTVLKLRLETYEPGLRMSIAKAQALADRLGHAETTAVHVLYVLGHEAGAPVDNDAWADVIARLDAQRKATDGAQSYMSTDLMTAMMVAESAAREESVDVERRHVWRALGGDKRASGIGALTTALAPADPTRH
jgi:hypothetical protein